MALIVNQCRAFTSASDNASTVAIRCDLPDGHDGAHSAKLDMRITWTEPKREYN